MPTLDRPIVQCLFLAAGLFLAGGAAASEPVTVSGAWIRLLPTDVPLAGYFTLHNDTDAPVKLTGATSPAFKRIALHHSMSENGMDKMKPVRDVTVPAGGELQFAPGGYHLMMWRNASLSIGDRVGVTLQFSDGHSVTTHFTVKGPTQ